VAEFKISGPLSFKIGGYEVNPNDGGEYGFDWGLSGAAGILIPAEFDWNVKLDRSSSTASTRSAVPTIRRHYPIGLRPRTACRCP